jgi:hypothetical protein
MTPGERDGEATTRRSPVIFLDIPFMNLDSGRVVLIKPI